MNTPNIFAAIFVAALLCSTSLYAADAQVASHPVQMVSGGIGDAEMDDIAAAQKHYSLKLIFAETNGAYLANVGVQVRDKKGQEIVNTTSSGPVLLMNLKPGTYTISSSIDGKTNTQRLKVHGTGLNTYYIHLRSTES